MKIEKISDNQIRCTLTYKDLADRQLKISELAYGTEKAKLLFRDMMQQASYEVGFEVDDIPLMIEAVPVSPDSIILIITKVEDPDELDTRFSKFAPSPDSNMDFGILDGPQIKHGGADEVLDMFKKLKNDKSFDDESQSELEAARPLTKPAVNHFTPNDSSVSKYFLFRNLDSVVDASHILFGYYHGINALYKSLATNNYFLVIKKGKHTPEQFNKVCNVLSEYGEPQKSSFSEAYMKEHYKIILSKNALQTLSAL